MQQNELADPKICLYSSVKICVYTEGVGLECLHHPSCCIKGIDFSSSKFREGENE